MLAILRLAGSLIGKAGEYLYFDSQSGIERKNCVSVIACFGGDGGGGMPFMEYILDLLLLM